MNTFSCTINWSSLYENRVIITISILLFLWLTYHFLVRGITPHISRLSARYIWREFVSYSLIALGLILILRLWVDRLEGILTLLSIIAVAATLTLKELILNGACWFVIIWRNLFHLGDRIEIDDQCGDVIDMGLFYFTILEVGNWIDAEQSTGRIIKIPNMLVLTKCLANYSRGLKHIWVEIPVVLTLNGNWECAKDLLIQLAEKYSKKLSKKEEDAINKNNDQIMLFKKLTSTVYTSIKSGYIVLTMRILCEPRQRREIEHSIWEDILRELANHDDIQLASAKDFK